MFGERELPDCISWQEEEVMYELAKFFRYKLSQGENEVSMAEIVELFGHIPEPHMFDQYFKIAERLGHPTFDRSTSGMTFKGKYYPLISKAML